MQDRRQHIADSACPRLDVYLAEETDKTRSYIKQLNDAGHILVNGERVKCGKAVRAGDVIDVTFPQTECAILPEDIPLDILYEDDDIAVLNKQRGLVVHPAAGHASGTLVNALLYRIKNLSGINGVVRPGIVHRLDKNTTGVMVVAKNDAAHLSLSRQIAAREIQKLYLGLLEGNLPQESGRVQTLLARDSKERKRMAVVTRDGRDAQTDYRVLERYKNNCLALFDLKTGRTHQIRVHAKYLGHPLIGDDVYGFAKQRFSLNGQLLHSYKLTLCHPVRGGQMTFMAPPPEDFMRILALLRRESGMDETLALPL